VTAAAAAAAAADDDDDDKPLSASSALEQIAHGITLCYSSVKSRDTLTNLRVMFMPGKL